MSGGFLLDEYNRNNVRLQNINDVINKNTGQYRTDERGMQNIMNVRNQINEKLHAMQSGKLYYPTIPQMKGTLVDVDSYPYTRMSRSNVFDEVSTVWERESGWHPQFNSANQPVRQYEVEIPPKLCYQTDCNIIQPCIYNESPDGLRTQTMLNNRCFSYLFNQ
jgi:hypothetical protein